MSTYAITYDLNRPGQNYDDLFEAIKATGNWWHCLDSTWLVKSALSAAQIRDSLNTKLDANDKLLVVALSGEGAWAGFNSDCSRWLKENL